MSFLRGSCSVAQVHLWPMHCLFRVCWSGVLRSLSLEITQYLSGQGLEQLDLTSKVVLLQMCGRGWGELEITRSASLF